MLARSGRRGLWRLRAHLAGNELLRKPAPVERLTNLASFALLAALCAGVVISGLATWKSASAAAKPRPGSHTVAATVVGVSQPGLGASEAQPLPPRDEIVQWRWGGRQHTAHVTARVAQAPGSARDVQVDNRGTLVPRPISASDAGVTTGFAVLGATLVALALAALTLRLRSQWILGRRMRSWEDEWERIQPAWTGRPPSA